MGWHMKLVICVQLAYVSVCLTREMSVVREWTSLDVLKLKDGRELRRSITHSDVDSWVMYKDKVFVNLLGQPYSLAYLDLTDNSTSPLLRPYPSYENQQMIHKPVKDRVDRCDRLWVIYRTRNFKRYNIIVFDLKTDSVLSNSFIPVLFYPYGMTVDDFDCDNEYVYISDKKHVWTYSWAEEDSWHHISADTISSMILAPNSIVYFNEAGEHMVYRVYYMSTTHLKDKSYETSKMTKLGRSRKLNVNLYFSALDAKSDILYYFNKANKTVIHAIPCWTSERCSSNCKDVSIDPTHELRYITVDENGYLWAITSRSRYKDGEINFRLLSVPVNSICVESNANDTTNMSTNVEPNTKYTTNTSTYVEPNAKKTINTTNIHESTTAASSTTEQTSTLGSVPKHTTVNIADTTAGTPNSNIITQAVVGVTNMPYLLFSIANVTFNLSNVTIINFPNNHFH